jgi:hypothetical protein
MTDAQPLINACHVEDVQAWQHSKLIAISKLALHCSFVVRNG